MKVLSLFDGIACGYEALIRAGIKVDKYYASEIDKYAIQIAQKNHPDRCRRTNLKCKYGLTEEEVNKMRENQGYKCAICGAEEKNLKRGLLVDHDHNTGKVRGLLCDTCNKFLGFYEKYNRECDTYLSK